MRRKYVLTLDFSIFVLVNARIRDVSIVCWQNGRRYFCDLNTSVARAVWSGGRIWFLLVVWKFNSLIKERARQNNVTYARGF